MGDCKEGREDISFEVSSISSDDEHREDISFEVSSISSDEDISFVVSGVSSDDEHREDISFEVSDSEDGDVDSDTDTGDDGDGDDGDGDADDEDDDDDDDDNDDANDTGDDGDGDDGDGDDGFARKQWREGREVDRKGPRVERSRYLVDFRRFEASHISSLPDGNSELRTSEAIVREPCRCALHPGGCLPYLLGKVGAQNMKDLAQEAKESAGATFDRYICRCNEECFEVVLNPHTHEHTHAHEHTHTHAQGTGSSWELQWSRAATRPPHTYSRYMATGFVARHSLGFTRYQNPQCPICLGTREKGVSGKYTALVFAPHGRT